MGLIWSINGGVGRGGKGRRTRNAKISALQKSAAEFAVCEKTFERGLGNGVFVFEILPDMECQHAYATLAAKSLAQARRGQKSCCAHCCVIVLSYERS